MENDEIATFNVKNISVRLIHVGGVSIPPEHVVAVVDDPKGINRIDVEQSEYLEETDEEVTASTSLVAPEKPVNATAKKAAAKTATGAGWNAKKD